MTTIYRAHIETGYIEYLSQEEAEATSDNVEVIERAITEEEIAAELAAQQPQQGE